MGGRWVGAGSHPLKYGFNYHRTLLQHSHTLLNTIVPEMTDGVPDDKEWMCFGELMGFHF